MVKNHIWRVTRTFDGLASTMDKSALIRSILEMRWFVLSRDITWGGGGDAQRVYGARGKTKLANLKSTGCTSIAGRVKRPCG